MSTRKIRYLKKQLREAQAELREATSGPDYENDAFLEVKPGPLGSKFVLTIGDRHIGEFDNLLEAIKVWGEEAREDDYRGQQDIWFIKNQEMSSLGDKLHELKDLLPVNKLGPGYKVLDR